MSFFQHYRYSTIGMELDEVIADMVGSNEMDAELGALVQLQFDKAMSASLGSLLTNKAIMRGKIQTYRNCDGIWTFVVKDANVRIDQSASEEHIDKVKITACDSSKLAAGTRK